MDEKALFIKFWAREAPVTCEVFRRIPEASEYKPDPKSRTAREIAWQILCEERMIIEALETGVVTWNPPVMPESMRAIASAYSAHSDDVIARWKALPESKWNGDLDFFGGKRPASEMAWSFLFDIVHHRGQITTYLRPMGSTVPRIYGPSADEP